MRNKNRQKIRFLLWNGRKTANNKRKKFQLKYFLLNIFLVLFNMVTSNTPVSYQMYIYKR